MSFRSEVREFINSQKQCKEFIKILMSEIAALRSQNAKLMDRLMATSFQELKVYSEDDDSLNPSLAYQETKDEDDYQNAGEIV
jgi:regulator of replication initiation timing